MKHKNSRSFLNKTDVTSLRRSLSNIRANFCDEFQTNIRTYPKVSILWAL